MSFFAFLYRSLRYDYAVHLLTALGAGLTSAVLIGVLLLGDSMRGSLKALTLQRLGRVDTVLSGSGFLSETVVRTGDQTGDQPLPEPFTACVPTILLPAAVLKEAVLTEGRRTEKEGEDAIDGRTAGIERQTKKVQLIANSHTENTFAINRTLADALQIRQPGERLLLRVELPESIPRESVLGRRDETLLHAPITIEKILPDEGFARFSLRPDQRVAPTVFVPLAWLQRRLGQPGKVNFFLLETDNPAVPVDAARREAFRDRLAPKPDDLGIDLVERNGVEYLTSARMLFNDAQAAFLETVFPEPALPETTGTAISDSASQRRATPYLIYLAESIACPEKKTSVPYSTLCAINPDQLTGIPPPLQTIAPPRIAITRDEYTLDECILNEWTATELQVVQGDTVEITYFAPESLRGEIQTRTASLTVGGIVSMRGFGADHRLIPELRGITDERSIADWNPPFPFDAKKIRKQDEQYWDDYRAAPKVFVSLETGRKLWGSRFGKTTGFVRSQPQPQSQHPSQSQPGDVFDDPSADRIAPTEPSTIFGMSQQAFLQKLGEPGSPFALDLQPVKQQGLAASSGTTPFNVLFLMMSFFIIGAALTLLALLFRLSVQRRAVRIGTLSALGIPPERIARLLLAEGFCLSLFGTVLGVPLGIAYAALLVHGLNTWWTEAIVVPFLSLHIGLTSLAVGMFGGLAAALVAVWFSLRGLSRISVRTLLAGGFEGRQTETIHAGRKNRRGDSRRVVPHVIPILCASGIVLSALLGARQTDEMNRAGFFFGAGTLGLFLGLLWIRKCVLRENNGMGATIGDIGSIGSIDRLAVSNARRRPMRSLLCIGLIAQTVFLILAVGAFRMNAGTISADKTGGTGGYEVVLETALPVFYDLNTPRGRRSMDFDPGEERTFREKIDHVVSFAVRDGDSASCQNLYQARTPRILGVSRDFVARGGFAFAAKEKNKAKNVETNPDSTNPWRVLEESDTDGTVPVILDAATAMYALHLYGGIGETFEIDGVRCRVAALLANSVFQGDVLMSATHLRRRFPDVGGFRFFLVAGKAGAGAETLLTESLFSEKLADYGPEIESVRTRLARFFSVQNTYITCFQSLGAVGLLFGVLGLSLVQIRNIRERRGELALFRSLGFEKRTLVRLILGEGLFLLAAGLLLGMTAAALAVLPLNHDWSALPRFLPMLLSLVLILLAVGLLSNVAAAVAALRVPIAATLGKER